MMRKVIPCPAFQSVKKIIANYIIFYHQPRRQYHRAHAAIIFSRYNRNILRCYLAYNSHFHELSQPKQGAGYQYIGDRGTMSSDQSYSHEERQHRRHAARGNQENEWPKLSAPTLESSIAGPGSRYENEAKLPYTETVLTGEAAPVRPDAPLSRFNITVLVIALIALAASMVINVYPSSYGVDPRVADMERTLSDIRTELQGLKELMVALEHKIAVLQADTEHKFIKFGESGNVDRPASFNPCDALRYCNTAEHISSKPTGVPSSASSSPSSPAQTDLPFLSPRGYVAIYDNFHALAWIIILVGAVLFSREHDYPMRGVAFSVVCLLLDGIWFIDYYHDHTSFIGALVTIPLLLLYGTLLMLLWFQESKHPVWLIRVIVFPPAAFMFALVGVLFACEWMGFHEKLYVLVGVVVTATVVVIFIAASFDLRCFHKPNFSDVCLFTVLSCNIFIGVEYLKRYMDWSWF